MILRGSAAVVALLLCFACARAQPTPIPTNAVINVLAQGAKGDCSTDDSTAIQGAINALPAGGTVIFPLPPGGCYSIGSGTAITLSGRAPVKLEGIGRGATILRASASIDAVITIAVGYSTGGYEISDLTIDGGGRAQYGINAKQSVKGIFENLFVLNAKEANFVLGDGSTNTQENVLTNIRFDNNYTNKIADLPPYDLKLNHASNNSLINIKAANAKTANIYATNGSGNSMINVHGYDYFSGAGQAPTYNFLINDFADSINNCEGDGSATADMELTGFGNVVEACYFQFDGVTAQIGVRFGNGTSGNLVIGNEVSNASVANTVSQAGSAGPGGNTALANYNLTTGGTVPNIIDSVAAVSCDGAPSPSFAVANGLVTHC